MYILAELSFPGFNLWPFGLSFPSCPQISQASHNKWYLDPEWVAVAECVRSLNRGASRGLIAVRRPVVPVVQSASLKLHNLETLKYHVRDSPAPVLPPERSTVFNGATDIVPFILREQRL